MNEDNIEVNFVREVNLYNETNKQEFLKKDKKLIRTKQSKKLLILKFL